MIAAADPRPLPDQLRQLLPRLGRLPIFPLPRAALLPGAVLPLYVFEPRYRAMTAACLGDGGVMAVAALEPGFEADYEGRPPVRPIAGAGLIVAHQQNPDGTYHILLKGLGRVRIDEELPPDRPYREVRASLLPDHPPGPEIAAARQALLSLTDRLLGRLAGRGAEGAEELGRLCHALPGPGELTDVLAAALLQDPALLLQLLETLDVSLRLELVAAEVARLLSLTGGGGGAAN